MRPFVPLAALLAALLWTSPAWTQSGRTTTKKPAARKPAAAAKLLQARPDTTCPAVLGTGLKTRREFCDVMVGRDPQTGIVITIPRHRGDAKLRFELHNREMVSEQLLRENRAYARHTATIGVLAMDGTLLTRAVVDTEFRGPGDLFDRVGGGAGPGGVKAVAPIGDEKIQVDVPEEYDVVSVLGERLISLTPDGTETFTAPGRPIAIISNVSIDYRPGAPARKKAPPKKPTRK